MSYGFVYLLGNQAMPCYYKIGMTDRAPHQRAEELSGSTAIPHPFGVICYIEVENPREEEQRLHRVLSDYRANDSREFFIFKPTSIPHVIGIFKYHPWQLAYTECDISEYYHPEFEQINPWADSDEEPRLPKDAPAKRIYVRVEDY